MATQQELTVVTLIAGADLSSDQFKFVSIAADGQIDPTGDGAEADGVLQDKPSAVGKAALVAIGGIAKIVAGGTVTAGDDVGSGADGVAVPAATGDIINGVAVTGGASGELVEVLLKPGGRASA